MTDTQPNPSEPKKQSAQDLWSTAYQEEAKAKQADATPANTAPADARDTTKEIFDRAYRTEPQTRDRDAVLITEDADFTEQGLPPEALETVPAELRDPVNQVYQQIASVFLEQKVAVNTNDREWRIIQAALDDPLGNLNDTLLAAEEAAKRKAKRIHGTNTHELWENSYKG